MSFPRMARFRDVVSLRAHLAEIDAPIPLDDTPLAAAEGSPLAQPVRLGGLVAGNRFAQNRQTGRWRLAEVLWPGVAPSARIGKGWPTPKCGAATPSPPVLPTYPPAERAGLCSSHDPVRSR